jgi:hypothetical protein
MERRWAMGKVFIRVFVVIVFGGTISGCAGRLNVGSGRMFVQAANPESDKCALVYIFRKDGFLSQGLVDFPPYLVEKISPNSTDRYPVIILGNKMYRPMLFEPGEVTFSVRMGGSETVHLKAGEVCCIEASRSFRGVDFIGVSEIPRDECLKKMDGLQLAMTITEIRRSHGLTPLLQLGFKDLELGSYLTPVK